MTKGNRLRDGRGRIVPKRMGEPFHNRAYLLRLVGRLQDWETSIRKAVRKPGGEAIDIKEIMRHVYAVQFIISNGVPHELCGPDSDPKEWLSIAEANLAGLYVLPEE